MCDTTLDDIGKQNNVDLTERSCVRVGMVPFISKRYDTCSIKNSFNINRHVLFSHICKIIFLDYNDLIHLNAM